MALLIVNKLQLVKILRQLAEDVGCHLSLKAALRIANWLQDDSPYSIRQGRSSEEGVQEMRWKMEAPNRHRLISIKIDEAFAKFIYEGEATFWERLSFVLRFIFFGKAELPIGKRRR